MKTGMTTSQPDERAQALVSAYERAGYRLVAPPILQPAEPFLDLSGEDIRKRMYQAAVGIGRQIPALADVWAGSMSTPAMNTTLFVTRPSPGDSELW